MVKRSTLASIGAVAGLAAVFLIIPHAQAAVTDGSSFNIGNLSIPLIGATGSDFNSIALRAVNLFLLVAGLVAFIYFLFGGFEYLTAGSDDTKAEAGRKRITNAIIGIIIIALSYAFLRFVLRTVGNSLQPKSSNNSLEKTNDTIDNGNFSS